MFTEAQQAMTQAYGGGKVSPDKLSPTTGQAPDSTGQQAPVFNNRNENPEAASQTTQDVLSVEQGTVNATQAETLEDLLDLASVNKKIKIGDEVFTREELVKSLLRHKDYTKKTQTLAQEKKQAEEFKQYASAFKSDLQKLLADPDTYEEQFREVYPEQFHELYDAIKENHSQKSTRSEAAETVAPEFEKYLSKVSQLENRLSKYEQQSHLAQVEKEYAKLDSLFTGLHTKYDLGDEKAKSKLETLVLGRAQLLDRDPTPQDFERYFKEEYESLTTFAKGYGEKQFRLQKNANAQAKDTGAGGGTASAAPQGNKTFKEAREAMEKHLKATSR